MSGPSTREEPCPRGVHRSVRPRPSTLTSPPFDLRHTLPRNYLREGPDPKMCPRRWTRTLDPLRFPSLFLLTVTTTAFGEGLRSLRNSGQVVESRHDRSRSRSFGGREGGLRASPRRQASDVWCWIRPVTPKGVCRPLHPLGPGTLPSLDSFVFSSTSEDVGREVHRGFGWRHEDPRTTGILGVPTLSLS